MAAQKSIWQSRYYALPRMFMTLVGIRPYRTIGNKYLLFAIFMFSFSIIVPQGLYLLNDSLDINDVFDCVPSIMITIIVSVQLVNISMQNEKIKTCFKTIERDWLSLKTEIEKAILQRHTEYGQSLTKVYTIFIFLPALFHFLKPVIIVLVENDIENITKSKTSKLPFHVEYGDKLEQHFYLLLFHCSLAIFSHFLIIVAVDSFYYTVIQHACGMFSIIGCMLENIGKNDDANFHLEVEKIEDYNYGIALDCLRRHLHVVEFAKLIESIFTNTFLINLYTTTLSTTITGIQVMMNLNNAGNIATPLSVYSAHIIHLFLQFWQGQFLLDYSDVPYKSICKGKWYYTSRRCRKLLLLIMNRTIVPCKITAGNLMTLSIENFGTVLKTTMSYFTILRSFQ